MSVNKKTHAETIADIIAEMRGIRVREFQDYADRIEAAHRREVATTKESLAVGNSGDCAKLREAALAIRADILKRRSENCWYATDSDILEKIDAALAAPPRNCDRFECATTKAAADVWRKEDGGKTAYHDWLFAPATEGGAK